LNDVHTVSVGRAFLDLHCLTTYDAVQQIDEGAFVVVGIVLAVPHFFALRAISTRRRIIALRTLQFFFNFLPLWIFTKKLVSRFVQTPFGTADI